MSYISRDGILKDLQEELELDSIYYNDDVNKGITEGLKLAIKNIKRFPTSDVVEVVRCKDCKYYEIHKPTITLNCEREGKLIPMMPNDYCSYSERREE